jgi:hydroxypyruvate reductase
MNPRRLLLELFDAALRAVDGRACVARYLRESGIQPPVEVFAIGKAASGMALGARDALGAGIGRGLVITKTGHADPELEGPGVLQLESAHPTPDVRSLSHGAEFENRVREHLPMQPLFLVSGGSSSLVEALRDGVSLGDLQALNIHGQGEGWDIGRLNAERSRLSRIKAGGIARLLAGRAALALFISDVPGDDPDVIGSGLLGRDAGRVDNVQRQVVASVDRAIAAAVSAGAARGLQLQAAPRRFDKDATEVAREFLDALRACDADGLVWGGESTLRIPAAAGRGGRNQHLALMLARALRAGDALTILAAGTDGTDGPTEDAGAIVDGGTIERAELAGVDVERAMRDFDSGTALEAAADLVHTGPTGTNVGDILIGLKHASRRFRDRAPSRML